MIHEISIDSRGVSSSSSIPGIFALSDKPKNGLQQDERCLDLVVADGQSTLFRNSITAAQISETTKVPLSDDPIQFLISLLIPKKVQDDSSKTATASASQLETSFVRREDDDTLHIQVMQRLPSGLVRKPWTSILQRDPNSTIISLTMEIVDEQHKLQSKVRSLEAHIESLQQVSDDWKDTAEKLGGCWEKEKNELLQNFLTLYEKKQEQAKELQEKVQQTESDLKQKEEQLSETRQALLDAKTKPARPDQDDLPDDNDEIQYDSDTVARLAGNSKKATSKRKRAAPKAEPDTVRMARNMTTGAIEYYDSTALFEDPALLPGEPVAAAKSVQSKKKPPPPAKKPKAASKQASKLQSLESDSETNSDEDENFLDQDLKNSILAQLSAMKESEDGA